MDLGIVPCFFNGIFKLPLLMRFLPPTPNPFTRQVQLAFTLNRAAKVSLKVFDASGRIVTVIAQGEMNAGRYQVCWNGKGRSGGSVASGIYFARLSVENDTRVQKLVLTR